ncbi:MAG: 6-phosphofructokinase [Christensenellaceae bacterium]
MTKIAVLTSGGDAPGMNACLRAVTRLALNKGVDVYGVQRGYQGLVDGNIIQLNSRSVSDILQRGGTFLKTARCAEFKTAQGLDKAYETLSAYNIDKLIVIGGDGTFRGALDLAKRCNVGVIGIPGTIDNDLAYTDYTLGFDTSVNTVLWALNSLRDTMCSHDRVCCLQVMGRKCGDIALYAGICGGAEHILVPEMPFDVDKIAASLKKSQKRGKTSNVIVFAEGAGNWDEISKEISEKAGVKITTTILGHIQRGGSPTMFDRLLATQMADRAVEIVCEGKLTNRVVGIRNNKIFDEDIETALSEKRTFNEKLYRTAEILGK